MNESGFTQQSPITGAFNDDAVIKISSLFTPELLFQMELAIGIVGLFANASVFTVMFSDKTLLKSHYNMYIIGQSFIDTAVSIVLILTIVFENDGRSFDSVGDILFCFCWLSRIPLFGLLASSSYNLAAMTIERYLSVVCPVWHKINVGRKWVMASMVTGWSFAFWYHAIMKLTTTKVKGGLCLLYRYPTITIGRTAGVLTVTVSFLIPLTIFITTNTHMMIRLRTRIAPEGENSGLSRAQKNVLRTMLMLIVGFICCLSLNQMCFLLFNLGYNIDLSSAVYHTSILLTFINSTINPFIYVVFYKAYQKAVSRLFEKITGRKIGGRRRAEDKSSSTGATRTTSDGK